jgi:outer membrane protein
MPTKVLALLWMAVLPLALHAQQPQSIPVDPGPGPEPLWELGMGGGVAFVPDYPGSDQSRLWAIPFPWGIYRGDILHSDRRGGTRARFIRGAHFEFNMSAAGGLPSRSDHNVARAGMADLEYLGAFGPRLSIDLLSYPAGSLLRFGLPVRFAFSSDFKHFTDRG